MAVDINIDQSALLTKSQLGTPTAFSTAIKSSCNSRNISEGTTPSERLSFTDNTINTPTTIPSTTTNGGHFSLHYYSSPTTPTTTSSGPLLIGESYNCIFDEQEPTLLKEAAEFSLFCNQTQRTVNQFNNPNNPIDPNNPNNPPNDHDIDLLPYLLPTTPLTTTTCNTSDGEGEEPTPVKMKIQNPFDPELSDQSFDEDQLNFSLQNKDMFMASLNKEENMFGNQMSGHSVGSLGNGTFIIPSADVSHVTISDGLHQSLTSYFHGKSYPLGDLKDRHDDQNHHDNQSIRPQFEKDQVILSPPGVVTATTLPLVTIATSSIVTIATTVDNSTTKMVTKLAFSDSPQRHTTTITTTSNDGTNDDTVYGTVDSTSDITSDITDTLLVSEVAVTPFPYDNKSRIIPVESIDVTRLYNLTDYNITTVTTDGTSVGTTTSNITSTVSTTSTTTTPTAATIPTTISSKTPPTATTISSKTPPIAATIPTTISSKTPTTATTIPTAISSKTPTTLSLSFTAIDNHAGMTPPTLTPPIKSHHSSSSIDTCHMTSSSSIHTSPDVPTSGSLDNHTPPSNDHTPSYPSSADSSPSLLPTVSSIKASLDATRQNVEHFLASLQQKDVTPPIDHTQDTSIDHTYQATIDYTLMPLPPSPSYQATPSALYCTLHPIDTPVATPIRLSAPPTVTLDAVCCIGTTHRMEVPITNTSDQWIHSIIKLSHVTCNNVKMSFGDVFSFISKCFIAPKKTELIKVTFTPECEGTYNGCINVISSGDESVLATVTLIAEVEVPQVYLRTSNNSCDIINNDDITNDVISLDFGPVTNQQSLPVYIVNIGRSTVPLRLSLVTDTPYWYCYSLSDGSTGNTSITGITGNTTGNTCIRMCIPPTNKSQLCVSTLLVQFNPPQNADDCNSIIQVSLDSTIGLSRELYTIRLTGSNGIVKLCIPRAMQTLYMSCGVGTSEVLDVPLKNGGTIPLHVMMGVSLYKGVVRVEPEELYLLPNMRQSVRVIYRPQVGGTISDNLILRVLPDGPKYQISLNCTTTTTTSTVLPYSSACTSTTVASTATTTVPVKSTEVSLPISSDVNVLDRHLIVFTDTVINNHSKEQVTITNPYNDTVMYWEMTDKSPSYVRDVDDDDDGGCIYKANYDVFTCVPSHGSLMSGGTCQLMTLFQPLDKGSFTQIKDLQIKFSDGRGHIDTSVVKVTFSGKGVVCGHGPDADDVTPHHEQSYSLLSLPSNNHARDPLRGVAAVGLPWLPPTTNWKKVYLSAEYVDFPSTSIGQESVVKIRVMNKDTLTHQFNVIPPHPPFKVLHHQFELTPRHCARLPIYYSPITSGSHQTILAIRTLHGHQMFALLKGSTP